MTKKDSLNYQLLSYQLQMNLRALDFPEELLPFDHLNCVPVEFALEASGKGRFLFDSEMSLSAFYQRMVGFTDWVDQAIKNMRVGSKAGVVFPKVVVNKMIDRMQEFYEPDVGKSPFYQGIDKNIKNISSKSQSIWKEKYYHLIKGRVNPAYLKLLNFLENEYVHKARESIGMSELPNGIEWYQFRSEFFTSSTQTIKEIHQLGLNEVERIHKALTKLQQGDAYKGFTSLEQSNDPEKLINGYAELYDLTRQKIELLFNDIPKTALYFEETNIVSHYKPGNLEKNLPGKFMLNTRGSGFVSNSLFLHEAVPGHHYQISLQQEMKLPAFRRLAYMGAYIEGWGLYAESLGYDLGLYQHPRQEETRYHMELLRAIRLVVDTGVHGMHWSYEKALNYMKAYGFNYRSELDRYIAIPAQALSYKVGEQSILNLKKRVKQSQKDEFDVKQFHDLILGQGAVPLFVLEEMVDDYLNNYAKLNSNS